MGEEKREREGIAPEWGYAAVLFLVLLVVGVLLLIPTETADLGFGVTFAGIGYGLIGISWIGFLWPVYKYIFTEMPKVHAEGIGEGISQGPEKGKVCPECNSVFDFAFKICPECGYIWPI